MARMLMKKQQNNYAFIDGANLYMGIASLGWELEYSRFRTWLTDKYGITRAYLFIGLVPKYKELYTKLQEAGFTLVFKETTQDGEGNIKGNCDAELVLAAMRGYYEKEFKEAVLVSSDEEFLKRSNIEKRTIKEKAPSGDGTPQGSSSYYG